MLTIQDYLITQWGWQPTHHNGEYIEGHCPFPWHPDYHPSFHIYYDRRSPYWRCESQCGNGDIIKLIHNMEFSGDEKMARAYARYKALNNGVPIKEDRRQLQPDRYPARHEHEPANEEQQRLMTVASEWWNWQLWGYQEVVDYLRSRGVSPSTFALYRTSYIGYGPIPPDLGRYKIPYIGYAPPASDSSVLPRMREFFSRRQDFLDCDWFKVAIEVGVLKPNGELRIHDRIMFSCFEGSTVRFYQGRRTPWSGETRPKYFSATNIRKVPFSIPVDHPVIEGTIVVEGPFESAVGEQFRLPVLAGLGSGLPDRLSLARYPRPFWLGHNNDPAGHKQAEAWFTMCREEGWEAHRVLPDEEDKDLDKWLLHRGIEPLLRQIGVKACA